MHGPGSIVRWVVRVVDRCWSLVTDENKANIFTHHVTANVSLLHLSKNNWMCRTQTISHTCSTLSVHHNWNGMGVCELVFHFLNLERFTWCRNHSCSCFGKNSVVFNWILVARQRHSCAWKNSAPPTQHMIFDTFAILQLVHMNVVVNFLASQPQLRLDFMNDLRLDEVHTTFS